MIKIGYLWGLNKVTQKTKRGYRKKKLAYSYYI